MKGVTYWYDTSIATDSDGITTAKHIYLVEMGLNSNFVKPAIEAEVTKKGYFIRDWKIYPYEDDPQYQIYEVDVSTDKSIGAKISDMGSSVKKFSFSFLSEIKWIVLGLIVLIAYLKFGRGKK